MAKQKLSAFTSPRFINPDMDKSHKTRLEWRVLCPDNMIRVIPRGSFAKWCRDMQFEDGLASLASAAPHKMIPILMGLNSTHPSVKSGYVLLPMNLCWVSPIGLTPRDTMKCNTIMDRTVKARHLWHIANGQSPYSSSHSVGARVAKIKRGGKNGVIS